MIKVYNNDPNMSSELYQNYFRIYFYYLQIGSLVCFFFNISRLIRVSLSDT